MATYVQKLKAQVAHQERTLLEVEDRLDDLIKELAAFVALPDSSLVVPANALLYQARNIAAYIYEQKRATPIDL